LIIHQVVSALLNVVANAGHPESQQYAVSNIVYLVQKYDYVKHAIREYMGENFYDLLEVLLLLIRTNLIHSSKILARNK
jgi:hypothetical protein